jgi:hypothetical protein
MLSLLAIFGATVIMYRMAGMSEMSSSKWGLITFIICFLLSVIPFPFSGVVIGLPISYGAMIYSSMKTA